MCPLSDGPKPHVGGPITPVAAVATVLIGQQGEDRGGGGGGLLRGWVRGAGSDLAEEVGRHAARGGQEVSLSPAWRSICTALAAARAAPRRASGPGSRRRHPFAETTVMALR